MGFPNDLFRRRQPTTREAEKERLQLVLVHDRIKISPAMLSILRLPHREGPGHEEDNNDLGDIDSAGSCGPGRNHHSRLRRSSLSRGLRPRARGSSGTAGVHQWPVTANWAALLLWIPLRWAPHPA